MFDKRSTRDKLNDAKFYIKAGQYNRAREILNTVNHPIAQDWLIRIANMERKRKRAFNRRNNLENPCQVEFDMQREDENVYVGRYTPTPDWYQEQIPAPPSTASVIINNNNNVNVSQNNYGCLGAPVLAGRIIVFSIMVTYFCGGYPVVMQSGTDAISAYIMVGIILFFMLAIVHLVGYIFWWLAAIAWLLIAILSVGSGLTALVNPSIFPG